MFQHVHQTEASLGKKQRTLDGLEEYLWLTENTFPRTTMILAEVQGATTVEARRDALRKVQQRYPLLSARVRKNPDERPYFEAVAGYTASAARNAAGGSEPRRLNRGGAGVAQPRWARAGWQRRENSLST
jgi:hypothetical protein